MTLTFVYGIIIEVLQESFTSSRKGDFYDVMANLTGIICALMLNKFVVERISSRKI
jgi:VanZ family protein